MGQKQEERFEKMVELNEILRQYGPEEAEDGAQQALAAALEEYIAAAFVSRADYEESQAALAGQQEKVLLVEAELARVQAELVSVEEESAQKYRQRELEHMAEIALREAGARNLRAARALLDIGRAEESADAAAEIELQVAALKQSPESAFLFGARSADFGGVWCGFVPAAAGDQESDEANGGFRLRLDRARAQGDGLSIIRLKQEAAREGVIL